MFIASDVRHQDGYFTYDMVRFLYQQIKDAQAGKEHSVTSFNISAIDLVTGLQKLELEFFFSNISLEIFPSIVFILLRVETNK